MIEVTDYDGVALLTLNHGPVNAMDLELLEAVPGTLAGVSGARAVVITGQGRVFSAGVDLKRLSEGGADYIEKFLPALSEALMAVFDHPAPTVAAINGHALAGGCVLAAATDLRLMAGGSIGLTELAAGVPFPTVPLEIMRHAVGPAVQQMILGAPRLTPEQATAIGLVSEIAAADDLLPLALHHAATRAAVPPDVYALAKRQLHHVVHERIAATQPVYEAEVQASWMSERTTQVIRGYLDSLRRG